MDAGLTFEQVYMLRRLEVEARQMSREQLIESLCSATEVKYRQRQYFIAVAASHGLRINVEEKYQPEPPETEEEFEAILGYVPTEQEASEYVRGMEETATMELDMDEIVLTPDDDSGY